MRKTHVTWGVVIVGLALGGCANGDPLDAYGGSLQSLVDSYCGRCWMSGNWPSEEACRGNAVGRGSQAFYGDISESERACMRERYVASAALDEALDCLTVATSELQSCIQSCTNSPEDTVASECYPAFAARQEVCLADGGVAAQVEAMRDCAEPL